MTPGNKVRLKSGPVIECPGATRDASGQVTKLQTMLIPETKSGTPGSDDVKVKGVITWVGVNDAVPAEVRLYDRLIVEDHREAGGEDVLENLNTNSLKVVTAHLEPSLGSVSAAQRFQIERHGYFVTHLVDHGVGKTVFNRVTGIKDSFSR